MSNAVYGVPVALFAAGGCDAVTDVAQDVNALRLQRNYGRSIINSLHAVWAVGAIMGGVMGATATMSCTPTLAKACYPFVAFVAVIGSQ